MIERERMEIQERGQWMWQQTPGSSGGQTSEVRKDTAFPDMDGTETRSKGLRGGILEGAGSRMFLGVPEWLLSFFIQPS